MKIDHHEEIITARPTKQLKGVVVRSVYICMYLFIITRCLPMILLRWMTLRPESYPGIHEALWEDQ